MRLRLIKAVFAALLSVFWISGLYSDNGRGTPITVNIIIDGSQALNSVAGDISGWVSGSLLDRIIQNGDRLILQSVQNPGTVKTVYSGIYTGEKEAVLRELAAVFAQGGEKSPDFSSALLEAAAAAKSGGLTYTILVFASPAGLSPTLEGSGAGLLKYSRIEEFNGWRLAVVGLNLDEKVRKAAADWISGN